MYQDVFQSIVLFLQPYKETDAIVKLFTLEYGKQMFFVKNFYHGNHPLKAVLMPFTQVEFVGKINRNGLSFLREYRHVAYMKTAHEDLYTQACVSYLVGLADAVIEDRVVQKDIYTLLKSSIELIESGKDVDVVVMLFELQLLHFFGTDLHWDKCAVTGSVQGPFDISFKYGGLLHHTAFEKDNYRLQAEPNAVFLLQKLSKITPEKVGNVKISSAMKGEMRRLVDALYDEYVGIRLKSKKFIDDMGTWYDV